MLTTFRDTEAAAVRLRTLSCDIILAKSRTFLA